MLAITSFYGKDEVGFTPFRAEEGLCCFKKYENIGAA
jgi:hypothetical protein